MKITEFCRLFDYLPATKLLGNVKVCFVYFISYVPMIHFDMIFSISVVYFLSLRDQVCFPNDYVIFLRTNNDELPHSQIWRTQGCQHYHRHSSLKRNEITSLWCDAHATSIPGTNMENMYAGLNFPYAGDDNSSVRGSDPKSSEHLQAWYWLRRTGNMYCCSRVKPEPRYGSKYEFIFCHHQNNPACEELINIVSKNTLPPADYPFIEYEGWKNWDNEFWIVFTTLGELPKQVVVTSHFSGCMQTTYPFSDIAILEIGKRELEKAICCARHQYTIIGNIVRLTVLQILFMYVHNGNTSVPMHIEWDISPHPDFTPQNIVIIMPWHAPSCILCTRFGYCVTHLA